MNRISTYLSLALVAGLSSSTALPRADTDMDAPSGVSEVQSGVPASQQQQQPQLGRMSPYSRYPGAYAQRPAWNNWGRPQQPLPYPMQPQTNSPFISGYNPGAESGFMSIPWAPQQPQPIQPAMGGRMIGGPANSRQFQQDSPYGNLSPDASTVREIQSPQPQQQPQMMQQQQQPWANTIYSGSNWQPQQSWSRPSYMPAQMPQTQAQSSPVQEVQQQPTQWMPTNQWRRSYTPVPGQSGCFNRCRPSTCGMSNNWANSNNNWWVNNNNNNVGGGNDNVDDDDDDEGTVVGGGSSNVNNIGGGGSWTGGNWNSGGYMPSSPCQSSCRTRCNIRPSCGRNPTGFMGNTMVCGRKQAFSGWGNQWGVGGMNWGMNQWQQQAQPWGYQQQPQQTIAASSAQTAQAATSAPAAAEEEEST